MELFEFIIIDSLGAPHGYIKAENKERALIKYIGTQISTITATNLFCILKSDLNDFKNNISKI